jgi:hypothetical protein
LLPDDHPPCSGSQFEIDVGTPLRTIGRGEGDPIEHEGLATGRERSSGHATSASHRESEHTVEPAHVRGSLLQRHHHPGQRTDGVAHRPHVQDRGGRLPEADATACETDDGHRQQHAELSDRERSEVESLGDGVDAYGRRPHLVGPCREQSTLHLLGTGGADRWDVADCVVGDLAETGVVVELSTDGARPTW